MGEFVARNMLGWFEKINKRKSCCILLVVYIVELMMHGHTNNIYLLCWYFSACWSDKLKEWTCTGQLYFELRVSVFIMATHWKYLYWLA